MDENSFKERMKIIQGSELVFTLIIFISILAERPNNQMNYFVLSLGILIVFLSVAFSVIILKMRKAEKQGKDELSLYSSVAHELITPLMYITGPLDDLYKDKNIPPYAKHTLSEIRNRVMKLADYAEDVIEFKKNRSYTRRLSVKYSDLSLFVERTAAAFESRIDSRHTKLILDIEPEISLWFDSSVIAHIINLLLANAIYRTTEGFVKLSMYEDKHKSKIIIAITDSSDANTKKSTESISELLVKDLCKSHKIKFLKQGKGEIGSAPVMIIDPKEEYTDCVEEDEYPEVLEQTHTENKPQEERESILLIEESEDLCNYINEILSDRFNLRFVHNGKEGLSLAHQLQPDLIISAVMIPGMNGIELCKSIKKDPLTANIPMILLTSRSSSESRINAYDAGADSYILKPFNREILLSRIDNIFRNRQKLVDSICSGGVRSTTKQIKEEDILIQKFIRIVEENLTIEKMDVNFIANDLSMSQSTLYRKIKASSGLSPVELIKNIRLDKAAELLSATNKTVAEISWLVGINSPVYFRNCFKERFGKSPTQYREDHISSGA